MFFFKLDFDPKQFCGVSIDHLPSVEDVKVKNILNYSSCILKNFQQIAQFPPISFTMHRLNEEIYPRKLFFCARWCLRSWMGLITSMP